METSTATICPACKLPDSGNLCSNCGEILHPKRITFARILKDIPDIFDLDYGLLYTIRTFMTRPGKEIREYFAGDRQKHYKPLKFILFLGGLVTLMMVNIDLNDGTKETAFQEFERDWNSAILILQFPVIALCTWVIFRSRKYNYGEHLVANAFLIAEIMLFHLVCMPLYLFLNGTKAINLMYFAYLIWILGYYTYAFYDWFYDKKTAEGFFKSLGVTVLIFFVTIIVSIPLEVILFYVTVKLHL